MSNDKNQTSSSNNNTNVILSNLIQEAKNLKLEGNKYVTCQNYEAAHIAYVRGLKVIQSVTTFLHKQQQFQEEDKRQHEGFLLDIMTTKTALVSNQSLVLNKLGNYQEADKLCTSGLLEIETIINQNVKKSCDDEGDTKDDNNYYENEQNEKSRLVSKQVKDPLLTGQIKLMYRRAQARESLSNLVEAEKDLQQCYSSINNLITTKQNFRDKKQNDMKDILLALKRVQRKIEEHDQKQKKEEKTQENLYNVAVDEDIQMDNHEESPTIFHDDVNETNRVNNHTAQHDHLNGEYSKIKIGDKLHDSHSSSNDNDKLHNSHSSSNDNDTSKIEIQLLDNQETQIKHQNGNNITERSIQICPPPEKQRSVIMKLLHQSPRLGEAFFLIHYDWWRLWCRHVNFFLDYEYSQQQKLILNEEKDYGSQIDVVMNGSERKQQLQQQIIQNMKSLDKKRNDILNLLPKGAVIPSQLFTSHERKKRKLNNSSSDNSSTNNMEFGDLSSSSEEEGDSECDEDSGERNKFGCRPGVINNSELIFPLKIHSNQNKRQGYANASEQYFHEWSCYVQEKNVDGNFKLRPRLVHGHHFEVLPREVYAALRCWYGESTPSICRRVSNGTNTFEIILYPDLQWIQFPPKQSTHNLKKFCGACKSENARLRCSNCYSIYYCAQSCQASHWSYHKSQCRMLGRKILQRNNIENEAQNSSLDPIKDQKWGRVGLNNLGNTCFMNSALQCLSHVAPLTRHFLSNRYKEDLNHHNPLGASGKLALAYDIMIKELWMSRDKRSISPIALKRAIAIFAPRFSGVSQHDSQEFLAFLLDGLHEDLNRIKNPPYVEMPEVTNGKKLTVAGEEQWDAHCLRNRSIVLDTFYGQFKSTCVCPKCERLSVSFDAFNHVSLEIPQRHNDLMIPLLLFSSKSPSSTPTRYAITVPKNGRMGDLKMSLSKMTGVPKERLNICQVYQHKICEIYDDSKQLQFLGRENPLVGYEIDPYSHSTMHVVSSQYKIGALPQSGEKYSIGYPMISSFGADLSCLDVWCHFRDRLRYIYSDLEDEYINKLFQIRIVDGNGEPRPVFSNLSNEANDKTNSDSASILPKINDKLTSFLEAECVEAFLFVEIEWIFDEELQALLDERKFVTFVDHSSVMEVIEKQRSALTLQQCFEQFTFPEKLDDDNKWYCSVCKEHVQAEKTMELMRLPNVLIVHLKRFEFKHSLRREKLETFIDFPLEGLDMGQFCVSSNSRGSSEESDFVVDNVPAIYDLFGVVNHYGKMGFGHYTAYCKRWTKESLDNDWVVFDDSSVRRISSDQVVSSNAYVLFYRRRIFV